MDPTRLIHQLSSFETARRVFAAIGMIFILSGLTVTTLRLAGMIPPAFSWHGPLFLILGLIGLTTTRLGLRSPRLWPLVVLATVYGPWTVLGLLGDIRQRLWPLVAGEAVGLALLTWALACAAARWARRKN